MPIAFGEQAMPRSASAVIVIWTIDVAAAAGMSSEKGGEKA